MAAAYLGEELHTTHARHVEVGNNRVEVFALQSCQGFFAITGSGALESRRGQNEGEKVAGSSFVVDGKYACCRLMIGRNLRHLAFVFQERKLVSFAHKTLFSLLQHPRPGLLNK